MRTDTPPPFRLIAGTYVAGTLGEEAMLRYEAMLPEIIMALQGGLYRARDEGPLAHRQIDLIGPEHLPRIEIKHHGPVADVDELPSIVGRALCLENRNDAPAPDLALPASRIVARAVADGLLRHDADYASVVMACPTPWAPAAMDVRMRRSRATSTPYDADAEGMPSIGLLLVPVFETYRSVEGKTLRSTWILMSHTARVEGDAVPDAMGALRVLATEAAEQARTSAS